jgi:Fe-S-cluster containining protein
VELEERTIEQLPDRCQNCGAKLTDAEKRTALTEGPPSGLVLCTTCASEVVPVEEADEEELPG